MLKIVFFDGYCNLCNGIVNWILKVDKSQEIKFASLQGETAKKYLIDNSKLYISNVSTLVYLKDKIQYDKSNAILNILVDLGAVWKFVKILFILPKPFRDFLYILIAKNRYRIFGKSETCRRPTEQEKNRLLP